MAAFIFITFILAIGAVIFYAVITYNDLVQINLNVDKAWANIDVLLKQRHDELPNLVAVCEGYKNFEQAALTAVARARASYSAAKTKKDAVGAAMQESNAIQNVFGVAEAYPELKANDQFLRLQHRITELENQIANRREFYNDSVNIVNTRLQQFPESYFARFLGWTPRTFYHVPDEEAKFVAARLSDPIPSAVLPLAKDEGI